LDPDLLASPSFLLLALSGFLTLAGFFIPFTYIVDRAVLQGNYFIFAALTLKSVTIYQIYGLNRSFCRKCSISPLHDRNHEHSWQSILWLDLRSSSSQCSHNQQCCFGRWRRNYFSLTHHLQQLLYTGSLWLYLWIFDWWVFSSFSLHPYL
jgi:hypothetical protein